MLGGVGPNVGAGGPESHADGSAALRPRPLPVRHDHLAGVHPDAQLPRHCARDRLLQRQCRSLGVPFYPFEVDALGNRQPDIHEERGIDASIFMAAPQNAAVRQPLGEEGQHLALPLREGLFRVVEDKGCAHGARMPGRRPEIRGMNVTVYFGAD